MGHGIPSLWGHNVAAGFAAKFEPHVFVVLEPHVMLNHLGSVCPRQGSGTHRTNAKELLRYLFMDA